MYIYIPRRVKYHDRKLNRSPHHDYSTPGYYFVTICARFMTEWFGQVKNDQMILNEYGKIAAQYWQIIPLHYSNITIDTWVIMPNHMHGIIKIQPQPSGTTAPEVGTEHCSVPTSGRCNRYGVISKIIMSYKNVVIKNIHTQLNNYEFMWQRSFHDHIIQNDLELKRIRQYILDNPKNWTKP